MTETTNTVEKLRKAFKPAITWLVTFIVLSFVVNVVVYSGFFVGIPSSAISLNNYDDLEKVKTWTDLKANYPALDPKGLHETFGITVNITGMNSIEEFTRPKELLLFHVEMKTVLDKRWLKLPSILVLLLDQNERIRAKLYIQQTSEDFFLTGSNATEYTFWFSIPSNMRGQNYRVLTLLFGVVDTTKEVDYSRIKTYPEVQIKPQPFVEHDDYYGNLPSWYYKEDSVTNQYRYLVYLTFSQYEAKIPEQISVYVLASYAWVIVGVIATFSTLVVFARQTIKRWWGRNTILITFAILFAVFSMIAFIILILTH